MKTEKTKEELCKEQAETSDCGTDLEKEYYRMLVENSYLKKTVQAQAELIAKLLK